MQQPNQSASFDMFSQGAACQKEGQKAPEVAAFATLVAFAIVVAWLELRPMSVTKDKHFKRRCMTDNSTLTDNSTPTQ